jgi:hypothetical protein
VIILAIAPEEVPALEEELSAGNQITTETIEINRIFL